VARGGTALLVVDLQEGVLRGCADAAGTLARTVDLVERARGAGVPVVWVLDDQDFPRDSDDFALAAPLEPLASETRLVKSYRDAFAGTGLRELLAEQGTSHLLVAGAQSDFCVRTAAQRAAAEGFDVTLVADCHTTRPAETAAGTLSGEQVVAHVNAYFRGLRYPGQRYAATPLAGLDL